ATAGLAALLLASAAPAAAPPTLAKATVKAALAFAAGQTAAALCSRQVAGLVEGGLHPMFLAKTKTALALLLALGLVAGAVALTHRVGAANQDVRPPGAKGNAKTDAAAPPKTTPAAPVANDEEKETVEV